MCTETNLALFFFLNSRNYEEDQLCQHCIPVVTHDHDSSISFLSRIFIGCCRAILRHTRIGTGKKKYDTVHRKIQSYLYFYQKIRFCIFCWCIFPTMPLNAPKIVDEWHKACKQSSHPRTSSSHQQDIPYKVKYRC